MRICEAQGCQRPHLSRGYCGMHYRRFTKHGSATAIAPSGRPLDGAVPKYAAIHKRLTRRRGAARLHLCVDCGAQAREWSYDNNDPREVHGRVGRFTCAYSLDLRHYEPRCTPCHRKFDISSKRGHHAEV
jgi:hypothetical protein